eukprot:scaffold928_cov370-Prasinococcus_capsulatus_cf.AAC.26
MALICKLPISVGPLICPAHVPGTWRRKCSMFSRGEQLALQPPQPFTVVAEVLECRGMSLHDL